MHSGQMYMKTRPKAREKIKGAANLQSSQKISITYTCEIKLGYILSFHKEHNKYVNREEKHFTNQCISVSNANK